MLNKVEVRSGNRTKRHAEIADHRDGFEKDFRQQNGGTPVEVNAAGMHLLDARAEEAEIQMRGEAESGPVGGAMHVWDVRADGEMNGDGDAVLVSGEKDARFGVFDGNDAAVQKLARGFAVADANALRELGEFVEVVAGLFRHAELARAQTGFDVFGRVPGQSDFEIMDERGAVHGDSGDEAAIHQVDQNGAKANFDDVAADAPKNGSALFAGGVDGAEEMPEISGGENIRKRIEEFCER